MILMLKKVIKIFKNDLKAVKNSRIVLISLLVIILIPSLYTLLMVKSTWDPYSQTSNIEIAVVNDDAGYVLNGTQYNVGDFLVEELKNNKNFSWQFVSSENAQEGVKNGDYYAAIIIPSNFSEDLLSISTSNPHQAKIEYVGNDKLNPIAPRMTEAGADAIQVKINSIVIKTIDGIIFGKLKDLGGMIRDNKAQFLKMKSFVNTLNGKLGEIDTKIGEANSVMGNVNQIWPKISDNFPEIQKNSNSVRENYDSLYSQVTTNPQKALATVHSMETNIQQTIISLEYKHEALTSLYNTTGDESLKPLIAQLEDNISKSNRVLAVLKELEAAIKDGNNPKGKLSKLKTFIDEMDNAINLLANNKAKINQEINDASSKLSLVNSKWPEFRKTIPIAAAKLNSIDEGEINRLADFSKLDLDAVGNYFENPVEIDKMHMYPINNYGSALAPFYMALSLWIGCIMAIAVISMRVRSRIKYNDASVYLGRMGIFLIMSLLQAILVTFVALFINIQVSSALLLTLTTIFIGMSFMIIVYSLTSAFGNAGKLLSVIFLVIQITAAGGTFPVELLSPSFQAINPYLPLTYAIGALREVIGGVLWGHYWYCLGVLSLFPILAFVFTLLIKEKLDKRAEWMEEQLKESGLF